MRSILDVVLWLPRRIVFAHYVWLVNLTTPKRHIEEIEQRCAAMHQWLYGKGQS